MRRFVLPGAVVGAVMIVSIVVIGNRVRQRKIERGELPEILENERE